MIDVHSHIFNLAYLPVEGILSARSVPKLFAKPVAVLLNSMCSVDGDEGHTRFIATIERLSELENLSDDTLLSAVVSAIPDDVLLSEVAAINEATAYLDSVGFPNLSEEEQLDLLTRAETMTQQRIDLKRIFRALAKWVEGGIAFVDWLFALFVPESVLVNRLRSGWPEIELFVYHMMDMDKHYPPGKCRFGFVGQQIPRMRELSRKNGGLLLGFVAYDPFRCDGVDVVRNALEAGFAGVKFYPPSGYRPIDNSDKEVDGASAADVDERNLALFQLCVDFDAPLFAHCSPGGMERVSGKTGKYSDPERWRRILKRQEFKKLRLCLGHSGGEDNWFYDNDAEGDRKFNRSFAGEVVRLCVEFENVYCETGHFGGVIDGARRNELRQRLVRLVREHGVKFSTKLMYGSDWHLLIRHPNHQLYVTAFKQLFDSEPELEPCAAGFFRGNALAYLNLSSFLERNHGVLSREEYSYLDALKA